MFLNYLWLGTEINTEYCETIKERDDLFISIVAKIRIAIFLIFLLTEAPKQVILIIGEKNE